MAIYYGDGGNSSEGRVVQVQQPLKLMVLVAVILLQKLQV